MWGATAYESAYTIMLNLFQFTHPVWGATDGRKQNDRRFYVSIHAPRVGCDGMSDGGVIEVKRFQFTHPVWGATKYLQYTAHTLKETVARIIGAIYCISR